MEKVLPAVEQQPAVDLVGQDHHVAVADGSRDLLDVAALENSARGILRRIQNDELRAVVDERRQFVYVEREVALLAQLDRHGAPADVMNHRFVNREAGIGIDDFVAFIDEREDREEDDRLAAGNDHDFVRRDFHTAGAADIFGHSLAQFGLAGGGAVVCPTAAHRVGAGFDHIGRSIKVGLADFQVDHALTLAFERARLVEDLESGFGAQPRHTAGQLQFVLGGFLHAGTPPNTKRVIIPLRNSLIAATKSG